MNYSCYRQVAERYIIENKGGLDTLRTYNHGFEQEVSQYMLKYLLQDCSSNSNPNDIKEMMITNKNYWKRFVEEYRK